MAQYDPQRSRSRRRSGEDEGPAPVDALLGPTAPTGAAEGPATVDEPPALIDLTDSSGSTGGQVDPVAGNGSSAPRPGESTPDGAESAVPVRPVVVVLALVAAVALAWAWLRHRRRPPTPG